MAAVHCGTLLRLFSTRAPRAVLRAVVSGSMNKQIAYELDITEVTVKLHRSSMMRKMQARSLPDLVIMAGRLGLNQADPVVTMP